MLPLVVADPEMGRLVALDRVPGPHRRRRRGRPPARSRDAGLGRARGRRRGRPPGRLVPGRGPPSRRHAPDDVEGALRAPRRGHAAGVRHVVGCPAPSSTAPGPPTRCRSPRTPRCGPTRTSPTPCSGVEVERLVAEWRDAHPSARARRAAPAPSPSPRTPPAGWLGCWPRRRACRSATTTRRASSCTSTTSPPRSTSVVRRPPRRRRQRGPRRVDRRRPAPGARRRGPRLRLPRRSPSGSPRGAGGCGRRPPRRVCCRGRAPVGGGQRPPEGARAGRRPPPTRRPSSPATEARCGRRSARTPPGAGARRWRRRRWRGIAPWRPRRPRGRRAVPAGRVGRKRRAQLGQGRPCDLDVVAAPLAGAEVDATFAGARRSAGPPPGRSWSRPRLGRATTHDVAGSRPPVVGRASPCR